MTTTCMNCGHTQVIGKGKVWADYLGTYTVCDECDSSYDIDMEEAKNVMSVYEGYTVHLVLPEGRSIIVCGDDYDAALEEYHKARQTALRECTIVDHPDGNGFWAMNREDTSKTYNVRFLKDYNQAYEHALSFYDYDAAEMYHDIDAGAPTGATQRQAIRSAVVNGAFLIYDDDIADFLESYDGHESKYADTNFNRYQDIIVKALAI